MASSNTKALNEVESDTSPERSADAEEYNESQYDEQYLDISESEEYDSDDQASGIPPFEKALQGVLGPALDTTVWRLRSLHESQMGLTVQLNILTSILNSYRANTQPVQIKSSLNKINICRQKLATINAALVIVEERLDRAKRRLIDARDGNIVSTISPS